jgi:spore germination cell wall hydrolase CwlJ-like protein
VVARVSRSSRAFGALLIASFLSACSQSGGGIDDVMTSALPKKHTSDERECLARAMFFESNRSSRDGLVAVGTVVMNRLDSGHYGDSICGVVGAKNQFAPGVLSRPLNSKALPDVMAAADSVLAGERHPKVAQAQFFHQAGLKFPYKDMHYVLEAGGNAFYEKRSRGGMKAMAAAKSARLQDTASAATNIGVPARLTAAAETAIETGPVLSFDVEQGKIDAIGAMLAGQARPTQ